MCDCNTILSAKSPDLILRDTATDGQFTPEDVPGSVGGGQDCGQQREVRERQVDTTEASDRGVRRDCSHCQWECKGHGVFGGQFGH